MAIVGLTDSFALPVVGKIRLGVKKSSAKGVEFPDEVPHFVLNPIEEVLDKNGKMLVKRENEHIKKLIEIYGKNPHALNIAFPMDDIDQIANNQLKWWGGDVKKKKGLLYCVGDGEFANYMGPDLVGGMGEEGLRMAKRDHWPAGKNRVCHITDCSQRKKDRSDRISCGPQMVLKFVVREYSPYHLFQLTTGSMSAIRTMIRQLEIYKASIGLEGLDSIAGVPMKLFRKRTTNQHKGVNYVVTLEIDTVALGEERKKRKSMLAMANQNLVIEAPPVASEEEPDYDLLPKSMHGRHQTGDPGDPIGALDVEVEEEDKEEWIQDTKIKELLTSLADQKGRKLTKAGAMATANKYDTKEKLMTYLQEQVKDSSDVRPQP